MSTTPTSRPAGEPLGTLTPRSIVRRALLRFVAVAALGLFAVALASVLVARATSREVAVRDAIARGGTFARAVSGPLVSEGVRNREPQSVAVFSEVMRNRLGESSMEHIRVWDS